MQYYYGGGASKRKLQHPSAANGGRTQYIWPATGSDAYTWATCKPSPARCLAYAGTNPHLAPGALLALPKEAAAVLRGSLRTEPGRRVADAFQEYGGYIVDDTASDSASLSWEAGAGCESGFFRFSDFVLIVCQDTLGTSVLWKIDERGPSSSLVTSQGCLRAALQHDTQGVWRAVVRRSCGDISSTGDRCE
jgi:hypothetical protein